MASKPPAYKKEVHFFPGARRLIWLAPGKAPVVAEAWGGEEPVAGQEYDVMKPRPTTPGRFVIHSFAPYRTNTWEMSRIRWGTKLMVSPDGSDVLYATGSSKRPWARVQEKIPSATPRRIEQLYVHLYGEGGRHDSNGDKIPDIWVFNDFGPWAVRYFRDRNRNKKLDGGETLSGEMIHTTPDNEGQVAKGEDVRFVPSHGCIHVSPLDRDKFYALGAFDRGVSLIVHPYSEKVPAGVK